jgi:two-component system OmpR family sensor kinase
MIRNLLENATSHGGAGPVDVLLSRSGASVLLAVEDHGPGVPPEDQERIFAPFYRRAPAGGATQPPGHGLGLALVRQVARYHGGDVVYRVRPAGGSRFEVTLPTDSAPPVDAAEGP